MKETGAKLHLGMVGGGEGAFIGAVHRIAARMDGRFELVAGCFDAVPDRGKTFAQSIGIAADRAYGTYQEMLDGEAGRPDRIHLLSVVTPNFLHWPVAKAFLQGGFHVLCEKPLTVSLDEAKQLRDVVRASQCIFGLAHVYSLYPLVRQAREMVRAGELGAIRMIQVEYPQDWLATRLEETGHQQAGWRTDPAQGGRGGCLGDIGTHAFHLAEFVGGLRVEQLCADLTAFVPGRRVCDNANVLLRFSGGARGMLWSSQVATGNENALRLRVHGTGGALEWAQEDPNYLWFSRPGKARQLISRGGAATLPGAGRMTRLPPGHPEGFLEAFANLYAEMAQAIEATLRRQSADDAVSFPTIDDGVAGMSFIEACLQSADGGGVWVRLPGGDA
jgi:predicted dehydrogenase